MEEYLTALSQCEAAYKEAIASIKEKLGPDHPGLATVERIYSATKDCYVVMMISSIMLTQLPRASTADIESWLEAFDNGPGKIYEAGIIPATKDPLPTERTHQ